jgi:two-component system phosphate regulon sensor histidine kinase PhoR
MVEFITLIFAVLAGTFCFMWRRSAVHAGEVEQAVIAEKERVVARLENELRGQERARRELEEVLTSLQDAVLMVDADSHIRFLNSAAVQMFSVRVEDVLGAQILEALPSFGLEAAVRAAIEEERSSAEEVTLYSPRLREVLLRVAPVRREGSVAGAIIIVQDLTELRRLERMRRDFVANASHELRTPVANIRAMIETLSDAQDDPQLASRYHPQIVTEAERLSRLVSDLLDLARLEKQTEEHRRASGTVDLVPIIYDVVNQSKYKALERHIEVAFTFAHGCGHDVLVSGDGAALEQVVFNLLDNALMYTPGGGQVTLNLECNNGLDGTAGESAEANGSAGKKVLLQVRDSGIGISQAELPRIFERFYRVDKARSRAQGGTGLGLAIVKHIVENHGGHISVESEETKGSTFTIVFPGVG